ncbi:MAG: carboxypeptidase M32 [Anaerolineales bacterium]
MSTHIKRFRTFLEEVHDLETAAAVLEWDQQVLMPSGGAEDRAAQLATLHSLAHSKFTSDEMMETLAAAREQAADLDPDSDEARLVSEVGRLIEKARNVPSSWVAKNAKVTALAQQTWQKARAELNFDTFAPHLDQVMSLCREYANFFQPYDHIYDPLLDDYEPGMKAARVKEIFDDLRTHQVALVQAIADSGGGDDSLMRKVYPADKQRGFGEAVVKDFGYDFERGRQDLSAHPFTTSFGIDDVRITTRFYENFLSSGLFSTLHEAGHAMYEQGIKQSLARTQLADGTSLAVHESQSRLWENLVGRSRPFWTHYFPKLQSTFPAQLGSADVDAFYRSINTVEPSFIRVDADEATYNLHIMLRFELEKALLEGTLAVRDLPTAWNDKMDEYLGIVPSDDAKGVLQDVHWSAGLVGYFPTYALGNLIASQWWEQLEQAIPDVQDQIAAGKFDELLGWLHENIHQYGKKFKSTELIERITGGPLSAEPYLRYLKSKFGEIYGLS